LVASSLGAKAQSWVLNSLLQAQADAEVIVHSIVMNGCNLIRTDPALRVLTKLMTDFLPCHPRYHAHTIPDYRTPPAAIMAWMMDCSHSKEFESMQ
jgi:hypothetical protein